MNIDITEVRIDLPYRGRPGLLAFVGFVVSGWLKVQNCTLIERPDGSRFVSMPALRTPGFTDAKGRYHQYLDLAFPIHEEGRRHLHDVVMQAYRRTVAARVPTAIYDEAAMAGWRECEEAAR